MFHRGTYNQNTRRKVNVLTEDQFKRAVLSAHDILEMEVAFLRYCRARKQQAHQQSLDRTSKSATLLKEMFHHFKAHNDVEFEPEEAREVWRLIEASDLSLELTARLCAEALCEAEGHRFVECFDQTKSTLELHDPVPIVWHPADKIIGKLNSNPARLDFKVDEVKRLALLEDYSHSILVEFLESHLMAPLLDDEGDRVATVALNNTLDFDWDLDQKEMRFRNVRPKNDRTQMERARNALVQAKGQRPARAIVFPELWGNSNHIHDVVSQLTTHHTSDGPFVVVAGSYHQERANEAQVWLRNGGVRKIRKLTPFVLKDDGKDYTEDIDTTSSIKLFYVGDWSLCILICKDFLQREIQRVLIDLKVRLILVPALTQKCDAFHDTVGCLSTFAQSFVVIANNPIFSENTASIFSLPHRGSQGPYKVDIKAPSIAYCNCSTGDTETDPL